MRNILILVLALLVLGIVVLLVSNFTAIPPKLQLTQPSVTEKIEGGNHPNNISVEGKVILEIDNDTIFNWFKTESQLCNEFNIETTTDRKSFCENKTIFRNKTGFSKIQTSPDKMSVGFTIKSDTLSPDSVVGIYQRSLNKVQFLTDYYLGNEFISFSPSGKYFVYQGRCFEALCGLFIIDSETLYEKTSLNNPKYADYRQYNATFVRWISDNQVEYTLNNELKSISF